MVLPLFLGVYLVSSLTALLVFLSLGMTLMMGAAPPIFSCIHAVCGSARRATAVAIAYFFANLIGVGLGPLIAGILSDMFAVSHGAAEGLRWALVAMSVLYVPSAWFMLRAAKTLPDELED